MGTRKAGGVPARLESVRRRFERWRRTRSVGSRIPAPLWAAAVEMARMHGIARASAALSVDYYSLKKRVAERSGSAAEARAGANVPTFVELATPARAGAGECIVELEDAGGAKMRIHLKGVEAPDLAALSRGFWGAQS